MVDNVLSDESGHRRFLFEEAAGIMRYKTRKKEALQKLDLTLGDLTRVSDIISEIEREVRSLARQVGKARRYGRLKDEIRQLDLGLAKEEYDRIATETGTLRSERAGAENRRAAMGGVLARHEAELEQHKLELLKREGEVRLAQEALSELEARGAALLNEVAVLRERRAGLAEKLEHARSESSRLRLSVEEVRSHGARLTAERARLELAQGERDADERRLEAKLAELGPVLEQRRAALAQKKQLSLDLFEARVLQESSARAWREKREELANRREELGQQQASLAREEETLRAGLQGIERSMTGTAADVERAKAGVQTALASIAAAESKIAEQDGLEMRAREAQAALSVGEEIVEISAKVSSRDVGSREIESGHFAGPGGKELSLDFPGAVHLVPEPTLALA